MISTPVVAVEKSKNGKTGIVSATYVAQGSCPSVCPLLGAGCYAENGRVGIITKQIAKAADVMSPLELAVSEAAGIDTLTGTLPLRLHVVGDCSTNEAAAVVSAAADAYAAKKGSPVWTYTHAWRTVERKNWGGVAVRASCETIADVSAAHALGYATAIVVDAHPEDGKAYQTEAGKIVPCPEQTRGVTCTDCKMCWTSTNTIAFAVHGPRSKTAKAQLIAAGA